MLCKRIRRWYIIVKWKIICDFFILFLILTKDCVYIFVFNRVEILFEEWLLGIYNIIVN